MTTDPPTAHPQKTHYLFLDGDNFRQYGGITYRLLRDWMYQQSPPETWNIRVAASKLHSVTCFRRLQEADITSFSFHIVEVGAKNAADQALLSMVREDIKNNRNSLVPRQLHMVLASHDGGVMKQFARCVVDSSHSGELLNVTLWHPQFLYRCRMPLMSCLDVREFRRKGALPEWQTIRPPDWQLQDFIRDIGQEMIDIWFIKHPRADVFPKHAIESIKRQIIDGFKASEEVDAQIQHLVLRICSHAMKSQVNLSRREWEKRQNTGHPTPDPSVSDRFHVSSNRYPPLFARKTMER